MKDGFISVAAATIKVRVADCAYNAEQITAAITQAHWRGVKLLCFPELCVTGYTCGDLFLQSALLDGAEKTLGRILDATEQLDIVSVIGLPLRNNGKLYNCAAVIHRGQILGVVPKRNIPNFGEFYELRWFAPGFAETEPYLCCGRQTRFGADILFSCATVSSLVFGVEICADLGVVNPPSNRLACAGATIILNPSASDETVGKADYRRGLISGQSSRLMCGYVYCSCGEGESSTDLVFGAHRVIAEYGSVLAESRFETGLTVSEIDVERLALERRRASTYTGIRRGECAVVEFELEVSPTVLTRKFPRLPFVPEHAADPDGRYEEVLQICALGLKKRLEHTGAKTAVIGLSGGLDSTLALMITLRAMSMLSRPASDVTAVTMPCFGTTGRTRGNAEILAERTGVTFRTIDITESVKSHFADIGQSMSELNAAFENAQARERTQVLMDIANMTGGLVVGTGDLSELALGWATYNGDHMSMYAVNSSIPKTLVRYLVEYISRSVRGQDKLLGEVLGDILATPVSPELLPATGGEISQKTEDLVGPYELHDFFLYYTVRMAFPPAKLYRAARNAMGEDYDNTTILKWLRMFYSRFFSQQFKRSCMPDGPKVGSVALSPRGDWRMPSDACAELWLKELDALE